jgi:two-component system, cell cycle sensor histidine kinase and response regulator CckA
MTRNLRVLIVEDSPDDAELTRRELRRAGYDIASDVVATEAEYARSLATSDWDIILCDHNLPGFDSIRALKLLQHRQDDIPFIIVSGAIGEETAVEAMNRGAYGFLTKPFDDHELLQKLNHAVERH